MTASVRVIIVNYNAGLTLSRVVRSVFDSQVPVEVLVYDNASNDGSADSVAAEFGSFGNFRIVRGEENIGFARAVNAAADGAAEKFLLILNPDCELLAGALERLCNALETHPEAAMAGPLVVDRQGAVQRGTLRRFPSPWNSLMTFSGLSRMAGRFPALKGVDHGPDEIPTHATRVDAVSGACMLVRTEPFVKLGGMDENYGLHCEDLDLMYRLRQSEQGCLLVPGARVHHRQGVSSRSRPVWVHWQKHRGMQRFFTKFQASGHPLPFRWLVVLGIWSRFVVTLPLVMVRK